MSLKAIAEQELARLRAGEMLHETERETELKQMKHHDPCFIEASARFMPMKHDSGQKTAKNAPCFTVSFPKDATHETSLPDTVAGGLRRLKVMRVPRLLTPSAWPIAVADANFLAESGWASKALALGWTVEDLFGAVTDRDGYADADGLAVWLAGRPLLAICETYASVGDETGRAYFNRCSRLGETLLWDVR